MLHSSTPPDQRHCQSRPVRSGATWLPIAWYAARLLAAALLLVGCGAPTDAAAPLAPVFNVTTEGDGTRTNISTSGANAVVDVHSTSGIGATTIAIESGAAPTTIVVNLHVQGLEALRLLFDHSVVVASVSSDEQHSITQHIEQPDTGSQPLTSDHPLWLEIQPVAAPTPLATPMPAMFTIRLPDRLLNEQRRSFTIRWIDFYR